MTNTVFLTGALGLIAILIGLTIWGHQGAYQAGYAAGIKETSVMMRAALIEARSELKEYELERTGEAYNNPKLNEVIGSAIKEGTDDG